MKRNILLVLFITFYLTATKCTSQKQTAYVVPPEYTGKTKDNLVKMLEHGQKLYRIHCSPCHGIFAKGKDSIPDFSKTQIEAYKSSALLDDPKNHAVAQKIRPEDLDMILQFLMFRKKPE
jgi:mono/diheme cytochrome c family protein